MTMLPDGVIPIGEGGNGRVFDFILKYGNALITDFSRLDKDVWAKNNVEVTLGESKERITVTSINALKNTLDKFLSATIEILSGHTPFDPTEPYSRPDFSDLKRELLVEQLVFDILFDKYIKESEQMTRNRYSDELSRIIYGTDSQRMYYAHAINENLARGMKDHYKMMKYSKLRDQLELLGVNPDKYDEYYNPKIRSNPNKKKPKFIWDLFYYNYGKSPKTSISEDEDDFQPQYGHSTITLRQYRRQLTRDSRNYSYEETIRDLIEYNEFVTKLLPVEFESYEKYFRRSMDYYVLESYKRVDFIFKLITALVPAEIRMVDREHFLVKRFVPLVLVPYIQDGELFFRYKYNYYRPLLMIEDALLKGASEISNPIYEYYESLLSKYQHVRAKAYELFKYHCEFQSTDYVEIKQFLLQSYNMLSYHQSNPLWDLIDSKRGQMDAATKEQMQEQIRSFFALNDTFFWKSPDRKPHVPDT